jgi:hypothetical protein
MMEYWNNGMVAGGSESRNSEMMNWIHPRCEYWGRVYGSKCGMSRRKEGRKVRASAKLRW